MDSGNEGGHADEDEQRKVIDDDADDDYEDILTGEEDNNGEEQPDEQTPESALCEHFLFHFVSENFVLFIIIFYALTAMSWPPPNQLHNITFHSPPPQQQQRPLYSVTPSVPNHSYAPPQPICSVRPTADRLKKLKLERKNCTDKTEISTYNMRIRER